MSAINTAPTTRRLAGASVGIPPRQVSFQFPEAGPRYFFDNNATATLFFAVLSGVFPPGEMFFVESVRHFRDRVTDPVLNAQVSGFIGQEAIHSREHERLNEYFMARGIDTRVPEKLVAAGLKLLEKLPARQQLACTTLMEHFTALLAEQLLTDEAFRARVDPELLSLWQWHALEELEHKSVAYDVLELVGNNPAERARAVPLVVATVLPGVLLGWAYLVAKEGTLTNVADLRRGLGFLLGRKGFITRVLPKMAIFNGRKFHPSRHDTKALETSWREKMFGAQGDLLPIWNNRDRAS